jgi:hypothetical protein
MLNGTALVAPVRILSGKRERRARSLFLKTCGRNCPRPRPDRDRREDKPCTTVSLRSRL